MGLKGDAKARREELAKLRQETADIERLKATQLELLQSTKLTKKEWNAIQAEVKKYDTHITNAQTAINESAKDIDKIEKGIKKAEDRLQSFSDTLQKGVKHLPMIGDTLAEGIQKGTDKAKKIMDNWLKQNDNAFQKSFKVLGGILGGLLLGGVIALFATFMKLLSKAKDHMMEFSASMTETARSLRLSKSDVTEIGKGVGDWIRYGSGWAGAISQIRDDMGYIPDLTKEENSLVAKLATNAGLGAEEISNMYRHSQNLGMSLTEYTANQEKKIKNLNAEYGLHFTQAQIIKEIAGASDETLTMFGKQNGELEKQVLIGKKIGLNLNQQASMAKSLLDIESSIESEMEARVLTGKELNFDKARELALNGDISGASQEIMDQVGGITEFNKMNIIQKEALAKAAGMEVGAMQKSMEMQAGLGDQADVTGGLATDNVSMGGADAARSRRWGALLEPTAKALRDLQLAIETKLLAWFESGGGQKVLSFINKTSTDLSNFLTGKGEPPKWVTTLSGYLKSAKDILKKTWDWVKANPMLAKIGGVTLLIAYFTRGTWINPTIVRLKGGFGSLIKGIGNFMRGGKKGGIMRNTLAGVTKAKRGVGGFFKKAFGKVGTSISKGMKSVGKMGGKIVGKGLGKSLLKKIPVIGALAGIGFGISRAIKGDFSGAALEVASGLMSTIPGVGTAASVALDAGLIAKDLNNMQSAEAPVEDLADFIYSPKHGVKRFRQDDLVIGGTKLSEGLGGGGTLDEVATLLKALITVTKEDRVISVDGNQLRTALADTIPYRGTA